MTKDSMDDPRMPPATTTIMYEPSGSHRRMKIGGKGDGDGRMDREYWIGPSASMLAFHFTRLPELALAFAAPRDRRAPSARTLTLTVSCDQHVPALPPNAMSMPRARYPTRRVAHYDERATVLAARHDNYPPPALADRRDELTHTLAGRRDDCPPRLLPKAMGRSPRSR